MPGREPKWSLSPFYEVRKASYEVVVSSQELSKATRSYAQAFRELREASQAYNGTLDELLKDLRAFSDRMKSAQQPLGSQVLYRPATPRRGVE